MRQLNLRWNDWFPIALQKFFLKKYITWFCSCIQKKLLSASTVHSFPKRKKKFKIKTNIIYPQNYIELVEALKKTYLCVCRNWKYILLFSFEPTLKPYISTKCSKLLFHIDNKFRKWYFYEETLVAHLPLLLSSNP